MCSDKPNHPDAAAGDEALRKMTGTSRGHGLLRDPEIGSKPKSNYRRPAIVLALVLVAMAACSGCFVQDRVPSTFYPSTSEIVPTPPVQRAAVEFGDSLSWDADAGVKDRWKPAWPDEVLSYNAFGGTTVAQWYDRMDYLGSWLPAQGVAPGDTTVIVALATNNLSINDDTNAILESAAALNRLRDEGIGCVVWLTLSTTSASHREASIRTETARYNQWLRQTVQNGTYGDLLVLQDWDAISAGHDSWFKGTTVSPADWVHMTPAGQAAYAETIVGAPHQCPADAPVAA